MGLIQAFAGAVSGTLADQWKEYFYCDSLSSDILVQKGIKKTSGRSSNSRGEDNVISDGSKIAVADGQCMIIVENGKIMDVCAEPGGYTYDTKTSPSIFGGKFFEGLSNIAKESWNRISFGGGAGKDQRIYYFNTKEILGNKYGTASPIPFRVYEEEINMKLTVKLRCNGEFSYRIVNPMLFYSNVCGNVSNTYDRSNIDSTLKSELLTALQPALGRVSQMQIPLDSIIMHTKEITESLNEELSQKWLQSRGLEVASFNMNSVTADEKDIELIQSYQKKAAMKDIEYANAALKDAAVEAMVNAASNPNGAMAGFMNMNAASAGAANLFATGLEQVPQKPATPAPATPAPAAPANGWTCSCGAVNTGKFCSQCGTAKPAAPESWTCSCGTVNTGKFCSECGKGKPVAAPDYKCSKCGWTPEDPKNPPKFCPECGDPFDQNDIQ